MMSNVGTKSAFDPFIVRRRKKIEEIESYLGDRSRIFMGEK